MSHRVKRVSRSLHPKRLLQSRATKQIMTAFANNNGFVYFGRVHHGDEDLQIVRGMTLSQRHRDNHYCVGSVRGYDVAILERTDILQIPGHPAHHHQWLIFAFDLQTPRDLPHVFLGHNKHSMEFYEIISTKFDRIQRATIGTFDEYDQAFIENYSIFSKSAHSLDAERLFNKEVAHTIMRHFGKLSVEIVDNCLYLYADHVKATNKLLTTMLKNGLWLAAAMDKNADNLASR